MAKAPVLNWADLSLEKAIEKLLEDQLAFGTENGVQTADLARALIKVGWPASPSIVGGKPDMDAEHALVRDLTIMAQEYFKEKTKLYRRSAEGVSLRFTGAMWVGSQAGPDMPWANYLWSLPMWTPVNELVPLYGKIA